MIAIHRHTQPLIFADGLEIGPVVGGGAGNGLLNALIAYWPGNEANGNALDLHTNGLPLTDANTVTSNPGLVYAAARQYTAANLEYHARPGDDALLSTGNVDFTIATWCRADSYPAYPEIVSKWQGTGNNFEYRLIRYPILGVDRFRFYVSRDGGTTNQVPADSLGIPAINTWYLIVAWHDSVADTINIQINNGAVDSLAFNTGVADKAAPFTIGSRSEPTASAYWDGRIGPTMFWKSAAGLGGVLDATKRSALYNAGAGLPYAAFTL